MWGLLAAVPMRLCIFHTLSTHARVLLCMHVYLYIEIYNTYVHFDTCKDMFYFIISKYFTQFLRRSPLRLFHSFHFSSAHESDDNFTEFPIRVQSMNFMMIWLFYKILHICNRSYWWYTYTCIHARMYACVCTYVYVCICLRVCMNSLAQRNQIFLLHVVEHYFEFSIFIQHFRIILFYVEFNTLIILIRFFRYFTESRIHALK